jgi:hypothetical protein
MHVGISRLLVSSRRRSGLIGSCYRAKTDGQAVPSVDGDYGHRQIDQFFIVERLACHFICAVRHLLLALSAAPGWGVLRAGVLRAGALRLAAVEVALRWAVPGSAVLFGAAPCESDLSLEAVLRAVLLPAVVSLASELRS